MLWFFPIPPSGPWIKAPLTPQACRRREGMRFLSGGRRKAPHPAGLLSAGTEPRASHNLFLSCPRCEPLLRLLPLAGLQRGAPLPTGCARSEGRCEEAGGQRGAVPGCRAAGHTLYLLHGSSRGSAPPAGRGGRAGCGCSASVSARSGASWR